MIRQLVYSSHDHHDRTFVPVMLTLIEMASFSVSHFPKAVLSAFATPAVIP
jgi:hypothetical protein